MTSTIDPSIIGQPPKRARRHVRSLTGYTPETDETGKEKWPRGNEKVWKDGIPGLDTDVPSITKSVVNHVHTSLARQAYNLDNLGAYQAAALSVRDNLLVNWNETQLHYSRKAPKRAYYLSLEFLMGRTLDNALLNLGLKDKYAEGMDQLGFNLEDMLDQERDAGLGNGGLGRLAACYLDSSASQELPVWGYGLRYKYGKLSQLEAPDPWLEHDNPWELPRLDVTYQIRFYGHSERLEGGKAIWSGGQEVLAMAYDVMIPGYDTKNTNNLRLWESKPKRGFDLNSFNAGDYERAVESSNSAAAITAVLYPNDHTSFGKELRLKQQYFWTAASLADIMRRFKNTDKPMSEFPEFVAIQLNDTHPTLAIPELMRILLDEEDLSWDASWNIVVNTFFFTNHTSVVLPLTLRHDIDLFASIAQEALERWPVPLMQHLLPRHMQIIFDIVCALTPVSTSADCCKQAVERKFPGDRGKLARMSLIEALSIVNAILKCLSRGIPAVREDVQFGLRCVKLSHNRNVTGSRKVNGVAEVCDTITFKRGDSVDTSQLHSELVRMTIMKDFVDYYGVSNNTPSLARSGRILSIKGSNCNPGLSKLISETLKLPKAAFLKDLYKLEGLLEHVENTSFQKKWAVVKLVNKERLAHYVETTLGIKVNTHAMFDVQIKRQTLNIMGVIHRYLTLKSMTPAERKKVNPKVVFFAGKAAPGYYIAKLTIRLIVNVARIINVDPDTKDLLSLFFLPDYSVSLAEILIPASDISQHISTAGTEASGTSNMKFCLNGGLLLGTVDGANIEIAEEVGESNVFFFGHLTPAVEDLRYQHMYHPIPVEQKCPALATVINEVSAGRFGDGAVYEPLLNTIRQNDYYLLTEDFDSYIQALKMVDDAYQDRTEWIKKSIRTTAKMGKFSSDRAIQDYAQEYWNIESTKLT
ncbi:Glycogen phosphorylase [Grifola frondosa]|uniref:Alpha-1,4 glucan phosphorylase n=1 Tax=Grifola frondosa TaxID=5627 RepID=A0A1C7MBX9_GRIFR|nr:Glycogen phosphorylase [Grifola frondosa]